MSRSLLINRRSRAIPVNVRPLRRLTLSLLGDLLRVDNFDLAIYLVGTPEMVRLNEQFLQHQGPTDVITLDYREHARPAPGPGARRIDPQICPTLHGEVFICVDEAVLQARRFRTTWPGELVRYVIHGLLHLCGYDDQRPADRRRMKREEDRLLKELAHRFPVREIARP